MVVGSFNCVNRETSFSATIKELFEHTPLYSFADSEMKLKPYHIIVRIYMSYGIYILTMMWCVAIYINYGNVVLSHTPTGQFIRETPFQLLLTILQISTVIGQWHGHNSWRNDQDNLVKLKPSIRKKGRKGIYVTLGFRNYWGFHTHPSLRFT